MAEAVLCQKRTGVLVVREACKRKERVADPVALGLQGPPGSQGIQGSQGPQGTPGVGPLTTCPPDAVLVGTACIDRFESSLWQVPAAAAAVLTAVRNGTVTQSDLTATGATQVGCTDVSFGHAAIPATFPASGNWTEPIYAVSIVGVLPSACVTWFQAEQACALSNKRLATNQEWQRAAAGTPDSGVDDGATLCNIVSVTGSPSSTGSRSACVSSWGTFDMVGNVNELVADWEDLANAGCTDWTSQTGLAGGDVSCFAGNGSGIAVNRIPGALYRGGFWNDGASAGIFAAIAGNTLASASLYVGFRCAR
ncbi:MAG TPA: SUMF1/EgtB/PvdO family nonheme iron enzyme [Candidatus Binatia bacterium]|nr:SUMF1/EgtB/PvdO family nonheme iron enzyme [Candidatus Binatia bacterium]